MQKLFCYDILRFFMNKYVDYFFVYNKIHGYYNKCKLYANSYYRNEKAIRTSLQKLAMSNIIL